MYTVLLPPGVNPIAVKYIIHHVLQTMGVGEGMVLPIYTNCSGFVIGQIRRLMETATMLKAAKPHDSHP
jgi:hypothetical protein